MTWLAWAFGIAAAAVVWRAYDDRRDIVKARRMYWERAKRK